MKTTTLVVLLVALCVLGIHATASSGDSTVTTATESTKTFTEVSPGEWRFCVPLKYGLTQHTGDKVTMFVRSKTSFDIKFDTHPHQISYISRSKGSADDHMVKIFPLVSFGLKELEQDGTVSGTIISKEAPEWIALKVKATRLIHLPTSVAVCKAILGRDSESAEVGKDCGGSQSSSSYHGFQLRRFAGVFIAGFGFIMVFTVLMLTVLIIRARCKRRQVTDAEMTAMDVASSEEERQLAQAIEASLVEQDKKQVVSVPQTASPQFVFVPPQFMPHMPQDGNGTPYVPMFHPQFMNYSYDEKN